MQKKRRRGRAAIGENKPKSMLKRAYLEPINGSMQKPVEGSTLTLSGLHYSD